MVVAMASSVSLQYPFLHVTLIPPKKKPPELTHTPPQDPSGIRFGTPALTTRGFGHDEFDRVAELVVDVLKSTQPRTTAAGAPSKANYELAAGVVERTKAASAELLDKHPLYPGLELS